MRLYLNRSVKKSRSMIFTVIIPTCNRNNLLASCLDLLAPTIQITSNFTYEVIVTDDSKQNIAKDLIREKYTWAKWIEGPKKGPAANRNNGAKYARGEWLVFIDDDCLPNTSLLENYKLLLLENPNVEVLEGLIEPEGKRQSPLQRAPLNFHTKGGYLLSCNFAIKKELFDELQGFDENFKYPHLEDYDFKDRVIATNKTILFARTAKVIHPWRKVRNGWNLGKFEEMSVYYNSKNGRKSNFFSVIKVIVGQHFSRISFFLKRRIFSLDLLVSVKIMLQHLVVVIFNFHKWKKKYESNLNQ
jgi:GT2 family glycosyltransferase